MQTATLADRMKEYEAVFSYKLPRRSYAIIRIDGRAFHTWTKHFQKPYSLSIHQCFLETVARLFKEVGNLKIAYQQSDEISLLLTDFYSINTQAWFDNKLSKLVSVSASLTTAYFNEAVQTNLLTKDIPSATFDARAFIVPDSSEVFNYFLWRFRDTVKNSISSLGQAHFSQKQLHGLKSAEIQEKLFQEKGINWADQPESFKNGVFSFINEDQVFCQNSINLSLDEEKAKLRDLIPIK